MHGNMRRGNTGGAQYMGQKEPPMIFVLLATFFTSPASAAIEWCHYDRDGSFLVMDSGQEKKKFVDGNARTARWECSTRFAALYDGDDYYVYDPGHGFQSSFMPRDNARVALAVVANGVLFYDGDDLGYYCDGSFSRTFSVDDNARAAPVQGTDGNTFGLQVGGDLFTLDGECQIHKH